MKSDFRKHMERCSKIVSAWPLWKQAILGAHYDTLSVKFYIAARRQHFAKQIRSLLIELDHSSTAGWIDSPHFGKKPYVDQLRTEEAQQDLLDVERADALIMYADNHPSRGGRHTEVGIALAHRKPVIVVGDKENVFHWHPLVTVVSDLEELKTLLKSGAIAKQCLDIRDQQIRRRAYQDDGDD